MTDHQRRVTPDTDLDNDGRRMPEDPNDPHAVQDSFDAQLQPGGRPVETPGHAEESSPASEHKEMFEAFPQLTPDELGRISLLDAGVDLEQGGVYLDLDRREAGTFKAIGGQTVRKGQRIIAKRDTDYELWNTLAGRDDTPTIERPEQER